MVPQLNMRVKFKKGKQRKFLKEVLEKLNCPNLRAFNQFGFEIPYSTLKNYYSEARNLPEKLFEDLILISKINKKEIEFELLEENFGQVLGGKKSSIKRKKRKL